MSDRRDSLERKLRFKREIAEALRLGVKRQDVADVVRAFAGDPEADPTELRRELQRLVPASARFRDDEANGDKPLADSGSLLPARPAARHPRNGVAQAGRSSFPRGPHNTEQPATGIAGC